ncbi:MAG: ATP-dependent helicase PcrA, partial [Actinomycetota bacterium]
FPHARALEEANLEEERRLCYVGMTRARERLVLTHARQRSLYGRTDSNPRSLFIDEIPADHRAEERVGVRGGTAMPAARGRWSDLPPPSAAPRRPRIERREPADLPVISTGDTVRHATLGEGIVIACPTPEEVVVRFPESGERRLRVEYAPLEVL